MIFERCRLACEKEYYSKLCMLLNFLVSWRIRIGIPWRDSNAVEKELTARPPFCRTMLFWYCEIAQAICRRRGPNPFV